MPLDGYDKDFIEAMFRNDCDVDTVLKVVLQTARRTFHRMRQNIELLGKVRKLSSAVKRTGALRKISPIIREYLTQLIYYRKDLWQEYLVLASWCRFDVVVNESAIPICQLRRSYRTRSLRASQLVDEPLNKVNISRNIAAGWLVALRSTSILLTWLYLWMILQQARKCSSVIGPGAR
jgi:hypothetical protein